MHQAPVTLGDETSMGTTACARTLHRYVAPSLETADPLGLNERGFARDLDLPDR